MSLNKRLIAGGPAAQCGINGSTSTASNDNLQGDGALYGLAAVEYGGAHWIGMTGGQQVYLYDHLGDVKNNANTSGINPQSCSFHNGRMYAYDTHQYTSAGGWKSWPITTGTFTETDHNCQYPRPGNNTPSWAIQDPVNPCRLYIGSSADRNVYVVYYADFPSNTINAVDSGYNISTDISENIHEITFDGNYFWGSAYGSNDEGKYYQMYIGDSKGAAFALTGVEIPYGGGMTYYPRMIYNTGDNYLWVKRTSSVTVNRYIPDSGPDCPTLGTMDYLCVAGGGGSGTALGDFAGGIGGGGGGAGGLRTSYGNNTGGGNTISEGPLELVSGTFTIVVGAGGGGGSAQANDSSIAATGITTITSLKGGYGGSRSGNVLGQGGNGTVGSAGASATDSGGSIPSATTGQGYASCANITSGTGRSSGGGGGSAATGNSATSSAGGNGGNGLSVSITGSSVAYAGGGGGGAGGTGSQTGGTGGSSIGGAGGNVSAGNGGNGTANTGSGGGGAGGGSSYGSAGAGGSGIVILRLPTSSYSGSTTGSPTVTTSGNDTIMKFTGSGTYVHS